MAPVINLKVKSDFAAASADIKKFGTITEQQRKKIEDFQDQFKTDTINQFVDRNNRATAAIKATRGPVAALTSQMKAYQRQIETLIRRGLDPESKEIKELTDRYKKLEKEIGDVGKAQVKNQKLMKVSQGAMLALGAGAILMGKRAVSAFVDFSKEAAKAASDAEETAGKFGVVFARIGIEASQAASQIADDFDLADSTVQKLLGDTGDILTGLGFDQKTALDLSKQVGTLALDLSSFTNFAGGAEGASAALTKALLGEAESAKALGIVIRQDTKEYKDLVSGIMEAEGVGLTQAKALAALSIATEQSKNSIGDYARTAESSANVQRALSETILESKELYGSIVNEALTPFRAALRAEVVEVNATIKAHFLRGKALRGEATNIEVLTLRELEQAKTEKTLAQAKENLIRAEEKLEEIQGKSDSTSQLRQRGLAQGVAAAKNNIIALEDELTLRKFGTSAAQDALDAEQELLDVKLAAFEASEAAAEGTKDETAALADLAAAEAELLVIKREQEKQTIDFFAAQSEAAGLWLQQRNAIHEIEKSQDEESTKAAKKRQDEFIALGKTISGFASGPLEELGAAIVSGDAAWADLGKAAISAVAGVVRALSEQAVIQSALAFASGNIPGGLAFAGAAAAGFVAAGAIEASTNKFAQGGSFETSGPTPILVGDNPGGVERVDVTPVSSTGVDTDNDTAGGGGPNTIIAQFGSRSIVGIIQDIFDDRAVRIPREIIQQ